MSDTARQEYVERFARLLEQGGEGRITGRIYAHLATCDAAFLSLQDLADQLGVSRGSVSMNTRRLIALGLLERVPVPGARGDHYRLTTQGPDALLSAAAERARALADLAEEGLTLQSSTVSAGTQSLRAMRDTYAALAQAIDSRRPAIKAAR